MIEGLYKIAFASPLGAGTGVVSLREGRVEGGDSAIFYRGTYKITGDAFEAEVQTGRHSAGLPSVLGQDAAKLRLTGNVQGGHIAARATAASGAALNGELVLIQ